jgi:mRNA-degrading endonuclease RelE of RelBE toxin-antitoxin system
LSEIAYEIKLTKSAAKDLAHFRQWKVELERAIDELAQDPHQCELLKGTLAGVRSKHLRIKGSGEARIAFVIRDDLSRVVILAIGHRENFYSLATRRYESLDE